ncbi:MAG: NAD-dependent epimerase/dehydratase family protein [Candidatus Omnitrophica bacterium]|nr:NAD-dependent epimerase/dehydratase family protein [Candidatus Omnitrophota bacterium]
MNVFVTGATGFIGRRLVDKLIKKGYQVTALVRRKDPDLPSRVNIVEGDILNINSYMSSQSNYDCLFHLAAYISFDPKDKDKIMHINGDATVNLLYVAKKWGIKKIVFVSSASTIGFSDSKEVLIDETASYNTKLINNSPYMASKVFAEKAAINLSNKQHIVIVNPSTVYGPDDWTLNSGTLIKKVYESKILPVPSGIANVVDVDDVVDGIIAASLKGRTGERYILGGYNLTFKEMFSQVSNVLNKQPLMIPMMPLFRFPLSMSAGLIGKLLNSRIITPQVINNMFSYRNLSNKKARNELGWTPKYSFKDSVKRAWKFYRDNKLI